MKSTSPAVPTIQLVQEYMLASSVVTKCSTLDIIKKRALNNTKDKDILTMLEKSISQQKFIKDNGLQSD